MQWAFAYQNGGSHLESNWKFQRGDIYFVKLEAGVGSEQNGARPAVILQNDVGNIYSPTLIVAALTSKTDKKVTQATHCQVEEDGLKPSIVQAEQIFYHRQEPCPEVCRAPLPGEYAPGR